MEIGSMGDIIFTVSSKKIRTFYDFVRTGTPKVVTHELIGQKPVTEFLGPGEEEVSFSMILSAGHGISPQKELEKLRRMRDEGRVFPVFIGGKPLSKNRWMIKSLGENINYWTMYGKIQSAKISITLVEYIERGE